METGMILGRFQVFHNGHLRYLLKAKELCDFIIIGITNPDPTYMCETNVALHRNKYYANPLTYYERMKMIQKVCEEVDIRKTDYDIVPAPLDVPEAMQYYIPKEVCMLITIHDDWSREKKKRLENQGFKVKIVFDEYGLERISSTEIRKYIVENKEYAHYVPTSVYLFLCNNALDKKIKKISSYADEIKVDSKFVPLETEKKERTNCTD